MSNSSEGSEKNTHSTAYYFLQALNEIGVEYMFCNFGTDHVSIIEELARFKAEGWRTPEVILCPHENVAVHMAGGYARMTGRGQAVLVHVDAGTANAAMGMHNLYRSRVPVLLIAGTAPFTSFGELEGTRDTYVHFVQQPMDQGSLVRPYVKWEYVLPSGVTTKEVLRRAHTIMQSEPTGPVYLMLPREVLTESWNEAEVHSYPADRFGPLESAGADPRVVEQLADRLLAAQNPMLITGYGGRDPATTAAIARLASITGISVIDFLTFSNIGRSFDGFGGNQLGELTKVDVGLLVDIDVPWIPASIRENPDSFWAQIDVDVLKSGSPIWTFPANLRIQGRSSRIIEQLCDALTARTTKDFETRSAQRLTRARTAHDQWLARSAALAANKGQPDAINPHYVCAELGRVLAPDDIVVNEAVTQQSLPNLHIPRPNPGTMITNGGGGLGASGGTALGVKLAAGDRCVVQIVGDGSFYFNNSTAVYAVAKQYQLPILTILLDNAGWGAVKASTLRVYPEGQAKVHEAFQSTLVTDMDFTKVVEASGGYGERVTDPEAVTSAISRGLAAVRNGRSALLQIRVTKI